MQLAQILHVAVSTESYVVRKIPADVIGVVIDHDLIAVPEPITDKAIIVGSD